MNLQYHPTAVILSGEVMPFTLILSFTSLKHISALPIHISCYSCDHGAVKPPHAPLDQDLCPLFSFQPFPSIQNIYKQLPFFPVLNLQRQLLSHLFFHIMSSKIKSKYCKIKGTGRWKHPKSTNNT